MALTQAESYADLWAAHRDQVRPLSPADAWKLREDREFQPPSRAHVRRIQRSHEPASMVATPTGPAARLAANARAKRAAAIADAVAAANRVR